MWRWGKLYITWVKLFRLLQQVDPFPSITRGEIKKIKIDGNGSNLSAAEYSLKPLAHLLIRTTECFCSNRWQLRRVAELRNNLRLGSWASRSLLGTPRLKRTLNLPSHSLALNGDGLNCLSHYSWHPSLLISVAKCVGGAVRNPKMPIFHSFTCNWRLTFSCTGAKFCSLGKKDLRVTLKKKTYFVQVHAFIPAELIQENSIGGLKLILAVTLQYHALTEKGARLITVLHILATI